MKNMVNDTTFLLSVYTTIFISKITSLKIDFTA